MFRLFLIDRLISANQIDRLDGSRKNVPPPRRLRNRRIYDRFNIDNKHLALLNDQDILPIRDVSENGFSTEVSARGFERLLVGDVYRCRIRYLREIYEMEARVAWKATGFVGWDVAKNKSTLKSFFQRLITPLEIATSLQKVAVGDDENQNREWYHGARNTDLILWLDSNGQLKAWELELDQEYIEWDVASGVSTGRSIASQSAVGSVDPWKPVHIADSAIDQAKCQLAADIFMALQNPFSESLVKTLMEK